MRSRTLIYLALAVAALAVFAGAALAADGELDPSFDGDGRTTSDPSLLGENVSDVAVDPQGRIVVVGFGGPEGGGPGRAFVARFTVAGQLDKGFSGDGWDIVLWSGGSPVLSEAAYSVALDSLGRILVGGHVSNGSDFDFAIARYTDAGGLDSSFSGDGRNTVGLQGGGNDSAFGIAVDPQNRAVLAGTATGTGWMGVARFTASGALEEGFGINNGSQIITFGSYSGAEARSVAIDSAGRIIVGGIAYEAGKTDFAVARLEADDGEFDAGFGFQGRATLDFGSRPSESLNDVAIDAQDRIVVAGQTGMAGETDADVGRLLPGGSPDSSFGGGDGKVATPVTESPSAKRVAIDPAGRILVAGSIAGPGGQDAAILRFDSAGGLDPSFGAGGILREDFLASAGAGGEGIAVDPQGRYVLGGAATAVGGKRTIGLARFLTSYPLPVPPDAESGNGSGAGSGTAPAQAPSPPPQPPPRCVGVAATKVGTAKADLIRGTNKRDVIVALGGNDTIKTRGGNDLICAGGGRDLVRAGAGKDRVLGGPGADRLFGEAGEDALVGGPGRDIQR